MADEPTNEESTAMKTTWIVTEKHSTTSRTTLTLAPTDWYTADLPEGADPDDTSVEYEISTAEPYAPEAEYDVEKDRGTLTLVLPVPEAAKGYEAGDHFVMDLTLVAESRG